MDLVTERLRLSPLTREDFGSFTRVITDPFVRKYLCDDTVLPDEVISGFLAASERNFSEKNYGLWQIATDEEEHVGFAGLHDFFNETQPQLVYALLPQFSGKGLATEAARRIIDYCFSTLRLDYLDASCDLPNTASRKVAERLGMKRFKDEIIDGKSIVFYRIARA